MDECIFCGHEHALHDPLVYRHRTTPICFDALACGRRRQKAEDDRLDPPIEYGTGVDGFRIAPQ